MIVFLKKIRAKTIFSKFEPVKVEALELEYLAGVLKSMNVENYIIDDLFSLKEPRGIVPDILVLTGYNVSEVEILKQAKIYKEKYEDLKLAVGGVHIQKNKIDFHNDYIDYVCHSQDLDIFKDLIENIRSGNESFSSRGIDSHIYNEKYNKKTWKLGEKSFIDKQETYKADRTTLKKILPKTRYLEKRKVALIKGSVGCNYKCAYCYCKEINQGHYIGPDYYKMADEIKNIDAEYFWIVDDVLFSNRNQALSFILAFKEIKAKKLIIYLRADFILHNMDLLADLKRIGIVDVIVGFESTSNEELKQYEKTTNALDYPKVISSLKMEGIDLTGLFMVNGDYGVEDFKNLYRFIKENKIEVFTISILTPIKGTKTYEELKDKLTTNDPRKFDFLHLVLPSKLPKPIFYLLFYGLHLRLLSSKRIWKYILRK